MRSLQPLDGTGGAGNAEIVDPAKPRMSFVALRPVHGRDGTAKCADSALLPYLAPFSIILASLFG